MATETNDLGAHLTSLPLKPNSVSMLNGQRYDNVSRWSANQWYRIPEQDWNAVRDNDSNSENGFIPLLQWYLRNHFRTQLKRILSLQRAYLADDDIHFWKSNKYKRADNRIASAFAQHISKFKDGLLFGKKIKYGYSDPEGDNHAGGQKAGKLLLQAIKDFNATNDIKHHDAAIGLDALVTGRAYELSYIEANTNIPKVVRLNPSQCFIIWNTDVEPKELCAVRYYIVRVGHRSWYEIEVYNNNGNIYYYRTNNTGGGWQHDRPTQKNVYSDVPITEFRVNDDRQGCFENSMDYIDAYDKAISQMANSEDDFSNSTLVVSGQVHKPKRLTQATYLGNKLFYRAGKPHIWSNLVLQSHDKHGNRNDPVMTFANIPTDSNVLMLRPYVKNGQVVSQPKAEYLTKSLDANEWQVYINEIVTRIQQFTGVPNLNNDSTGNQTQLETASRLMDALNAAAGAESNFRHGIIRRLKLLYNYWTRSPDSLLYGDQDADPTNVTVHFDLNLPLNVQETIQKIQALNGTNKVSTQTIQEMAGTLDGVPQSQEAQRLSSESATQSSANANNLNSAFQNEMSHAPNSASNGSDQDSSSSDTDNGDSSQSGSDDSDGSSDDPDDPSGMSSASTASSLNNPHVDANGSSTLEAMDPNTMFDSNGSITSLKRPDADNMLAAMLLMDSMYATSGFPSGFDAKMSSAVSLAFKSSAASANAQSSALGGDITS